MGLKNPQISEICNKKYCQVLQAGHPPVLYHQASDVLHCYHSAGSDRSTVSIFSPSAFSAFFLHKISDRFSRSLLGSMKTATGLQATPTSTSLLSTISGFHQNAKINLEDGDNHDDPMV